MWALVAAGAALILIGLFWPGALAFLAAVIVRVAWDSWARREQGRLDAIAGPDD